MFWLKISYIAIADQIPIGQDPYIVVSFNEVNMFTLILYLSYDFF